MFFYYSQLFSYGVKVCIGEAVLLYNVFGIGGMEQLCKEQLQLFGF